MSLKLIHSAFDAHEAEQATELARQIDAYEAEEATRLEFAARYEIALGNGDLLGIRRIEALAATFELLHPGTPPVLADWHDGIRYDAPAAA
ncbi:hypothetical protein ACH4N4_30555 [Streptomyces microflavus]|uniref:hypothetical protein n=1 Tax=Streptomyces microflavus TaxID=1919 RepID=UPI0037B703B3